MENFKLMRFENPTEIRRFPKGQFEIIKIAGITIGRATYEPGWRWSEHNAPTAGTSSCQIEHVGLVLSGRAMVRMDSGEEFEMSAGDAFYVPPGHDSWVIGDETYVSIHLLGTEGYGK